MSPGKPDTPIPLGSWRNRRHVRQLKAAGLFTIKDVADACNLPQPIVAQLVPRTWTEAGWMYTAEQLAYAVQIAPDVREGRYVPPSEHDDMQ
jgi:predicted transcriptional regulator of viral defense system